MSLPYLLGDCFFFFSFLLCGALGLLLQFKPKKYKGNVSLPSASVRFVTSAAMVRVQTQHEARFMARLIYCSSTVFVKQCFGGGANRLWKQY